MGKMYKKKSSFIYTFKAILEYFQPYMDDKKDTIMKMKYFPIISYRIVNNMGMENKNYLPWHGWIILICTLITTCIAVVTFLEMRQGQMQINIVAQGCF